jgi:hypothetical protein
MQMKNIRENYIELYFMYSTVHHKQVKMAQDEDGKLYLWNTTKRIMFREHKKCEWHKMKMENLT